MSLAKALRFFYILDKKYGKTNSIDNTREVYFKYNLFNPLTYLWILISMIINIIFIGIPMGVAMLVKECIIELCKWTYVYFEKVKNQQK